MVIPLGTHRERAEEIAGKLESRPSTDALDVFALTSGLTLRGNDLGSPSTPPVKAPRPFLLVGRGISGSEAGEVWHLLDYRFGLELPLIDKAELASDSP